MSSIDDLKDDGISIDATAAPKERVNIGVSRNTEQRNTSNRVAVDTASIPEDPEDTSNIRESYVTDLLEGPDSPFEKYLEEKKEEMIERMAMEENAEDIDEEDLDDEDEDSDVEDSNDPLNNIAKFDSAPSLLDDEVENVKMEEEDISSLLDDEEDEDEEEYSKPDSESDTVTKSLNEIKPVTARRVVAEEDKATENKSTDEDDEYSDDINDNNIEITTTESPVVVDEDDSVDSTVESSQDEILKNLQKMATEKLKPISQKLNLSGFSILKKPTSNIKVLQQQAVRSIKWVLPDSESIVVMREFNGSELESLREFSEDNTSVEMLTRKYRMIYDHITSPKPSNFETWLKTTPYADSDHLFFAVYIASFKGANYLPIDCKDPKCKNTFITDDIPIMNMVKFENDAAKKKFTEIYQNETTNSKDLYSSDIFPLSNNVAIGFKEASIYSLFELASLDRAFREKHSTIIDFVPFIDALYIIDQEDKTLTPIGYKGYPESASKTTKSKIQTFAKVLKTLTVDEFGPIKAYIREVNNRSQTMTYQYPEIECPKCHKLTPATPTSAEELVFTRYQLGTLVNTALK
jgi:hypothetical protein